MVYAQKLKRANRSAAKYAVLAILLTMPEMVSCTRGDTTCYCSRGNEYQNYKIGKYKDWQNAAGRCAEIQHQDVWDTCLVMEPK